MQEIFRPEKFVLRKKNYQYIKTFVTSHIIQHNEHEIPNA